MFSHTRLDHKFIQSSWDDISPAHSYGQFFSRMKWSMVFVHVFMEWNQNGFYRTQVSWSDLCVWSLEVSHKRLWNFSDVTPADEDTNLILTDNDKKAFQGNVAMWLNLVANFGTSEVMSCIKRPNFEPICNKSENAYLKEIQIRF